MRTLAALVLVAAVAVAVGLFLLLPRGAGVGPPPEPAAGQALDPEVAALVDELLAAVAADPEDPARRARLADAYHANGLADLAIPAYRQALEMDDGQARWWYRLALALAGLERRGEADAAIERAIALEPEHAHLHWRHGMWLIADGRIDEAEVSFSRALEIDPAAVAARTGLARVELQRRAYDEAINLLQPLVREAPYPPAVPYLRHLLGTALQRAGRVPEARGELSRADGVPPSWPDPWTEAIGSQQRGFKVTLERAEALLASRGGAPQAIQLLTDLVRRHPDDLVALNALASAYLRTGQPQAAIETLNRAVRVDGRHVPSRINLSLAFEHTGDLETAAQHARVAVDADPRSAEALRQLGRLHALRSDWPAAAETLGDAIRYGASDEGTGTTRGWVLVQLGRWAEARRTFEQVLANEPTSASAWVGLARALGEQGEVDRGLQCLQQAASLDRNAPNLQPTLARLQELKGTP